MSSSRVPPASRVPRASHLRQVSNGSSNAALAVSADGDGGDTQLERADEDTSGLSAAQQKLAEAVCTLSVHDDSFCRDEVLLNIEHFSPGSINVGDLAEIVAVNSRTAIRDFQDTAQSTSASASRNIQPDPVLRAETQEARDRSLTNPLALDESTLDAGTGRDLQKRHVFVVKDMSSGQRAKQPSLQVSVSSQCANILGLKNRQEVKVSVVDPMTNSASHVEICFKDEYLARSDMWRLVITELCGKTVYKGQKILFMGTIKANIKTVYFRGQKVQSAYFSGDTKPIFRSESARYVLFVQMSREMWNFDTEGSGEIMFNKVINGFLPELFRRWERMNARHLVSIILFTRLEYKKESRKDSCQWSSNGSDSSSHKHSQDDAYKDFFRVVVSEMASGGWATILLQLKKEFRVFLRDVSLQSAPNLNHSYAEDPSDERRERPSDFETIISGKPSAAIHGNILEAINLASSQYATDYIDRDLVRTGISVVIITPGTGLFEVDYDMLKLTTDTLIANGVAIDLVCLSRMPLHSVPLFKYHSPKIISTVDATQPIDLSGENTPRQKYALFGSFKSQTSTLSPSLITELGTSPIRHYNSLAVPTVAGDWSFAIPHWIDVSFWDGVEVEKPSTDGDPKSASKKAGTRHEQSKGFMPRCNMYELQMMGIMENEMSNISIPYIHESPFFNQIIIVRHRTGAGIESEATLLDQDKRVMTLAREDLKQSIKPTASIFLKLDKDRRVPNLDKNAYSWMDDYDAAIYKPLPQFLAAETDARIKNKSIGLETSQKLQNNNPATLGTSYSDHDRSSQGLPAPAGTAYFDQKMNERRLSKDKNSSRKENFSSPTTLAPSSFTKFDRSSRQISFGLGGLGIPATKAKAELNSEHASLSKPISMLFPPEQSSTLGISSSKRLRSSSQTSQDIKTALNRSITNSSRPGSGSEKQLAISSDRPSRPIAIKSALSSSKQSAPGGVDPKYKYPQNATPPGMRQSQDLNVLQQPAIARRAGSRTDLVASSADTLKLPETLSPTNALSPWLTLLNPSNPRKYGINILDQFRRWQHVFPRPLRASCIKWRSLCSPAAVPLTTEIFPTAQQLATEYQESPYNVMIQYDGSRLAEDHKTREQLMRELIAFRLSQGFQLVVGPVIADVMGRSSAEKVNVFDNKDLADDNAAFLMSMGNVHHQLSFVGKDAIEVKRFVRKPAAAVETAGSRGAPLFYKPAIRTTLSESYISRPIFLHAPREEYNWNYVDSFIAGCQEPFTESLRFWRARFVMIPVDPPASNHRSLHSINEDDEEEIRLEGIRKLTQMWKKNSYIPPGERQFQSTKGQKKDTNPLNISYQTKDPSMVVHTERNNWTLFDRDTNIRQSQLFQENELFSKGNINLSTLAQAIQAEPGVRMMDRRWHWRLHYNCFIGSELTTWLLANFKDVDTRDEAETLGNELMKSGLFQHVEKRHQFRDGNFFYQIATEYRTARSESKTGWFGTRRSDISTPSTPSSDTIKGSPKTDRSRTSSSTDNGHTEIGTQTPSAEAERPNPIALSRVMQYDVDVRKRSYRPEIINLHYDVMHNPDNCYHIRIDWMNVTAKLIEDAIVLWATTAEKFGLRLVEAPIGEVASIGEHHPFRAAYVVQLAVKPPEKQPQSYFETTSFTPQKYIDHFFYQKAIMKKFDFVLDIEAANNFPSDVEVSYSWGKPDYRYSQYIHRSGVLFAQITDTGNFLLLANRLYNNRTAAVKESSKYDRVDKNERRATGLAASGTYYSPASIGTALDQISPFASPLVRATADVFGPAYAYSGIGTSFVTPESIRDDLESFCTDSAALQEFYEGVLSEQMSPGPNMPIADQSIPSLGLPPSLLSRDPSLSPGMRPSNVTGIERASSPRVPRISTTG